MGTLLLIENDPAKMVAQSLILRSFGYAVLEADSGDEAIRACHEHAGPIHVIVTKAVLDKDDSKEVVARVQNLRPQVRALFVSRESSAASAGRQPAQCVFLQEPFRTGALAGIIRELVGGPDGRAITCILEQPGD